MTTTHQSRYTTVTFVRIPLVAYAAAPAMGYHNLAAFYDSGGALRSERDLCPRVPWWCTVRALQDWLHRYQDALCPVLGGPRWQQAPQKMDSRSDSPLAMHGYNRMLQGHDHPEGVVC